MRLLGLFWMVLALPAGAQALNCDAPPFQIEMTACAERDWQAADEDLNAAYKDARAAMRRIDAGLAPGDKGAEVALRDGQRAWVSFRDATCAAEGWAMRGGSAEPMVIYGCRARLTRVRAEDLRAMAVDY